MSKSKKKTALRSIFSLGLPSVETLDALCDSEAGIYLTPPEEYPAPSPLVILQPPIPKPNEFLNPVRSYRTPSLFFAKISNPLYFKFCNLSATDTGEIIRESYPNRNATFDMWPFTYLPGREKNEGVYYYDCNPECFYPYDVIIAAHSSAGVFGHFLLDTVATAVLFRRQLLAGQLKLALFEPLPWMLELLSASGIPYSSILVMSQTTVRFRSAIVSSALDATSTYLPGSIVTNMYDAMRKGASRPIAPLRLFLLRGEKAQRIANEFEVATVFADAGFLVAEPHRLPLSTQLALASGADTMAGSFGSGHALSGLMATGSIAIEFLPLGKEDAWFVRSAARRQLDHRIVVTGVDGTVDIGWLKSRLGDLCQRV